VNGRESIKRLEMIPRQARDGCYCSPWNSTYFPQGGAQWNIFGLSGLFSFSSFSRFFSLSGLFGLSGNIIHFGNGRAAFAKEASIGICLVFLVCLVCLVFRVYFVCSNLDKSSNNSSET